MAWGVSNITLNPADTFHFTLGVIYDNVTPQNAYGPGDNIVVIWPKADAPISQSTQYFYNNLHVLNASAMQEYGLNELSNEVKLIDSEIFVETNDFNEVQVYSIEGKLLYMSVKLNLLLLRIGFPGTYVVTVLSKENSAYSTRIVVK